MMPEGLRICYLGSYDPEHVRNRVIITGLERLGCEVTQIYEAIWNGADTAQRVRVARGGLWQPALWWRLLRTYAKLSRRYLRCAPHDLVVVGYPGHLDLPVARLLTWLRRKPLAFDALVSLYETVVEDRELLAPHGLSARVLLRLERLLYRLPDRILVDTEAHATLFVEQYGAPRTRLWRVWVGAPDDLTAPEETMLPPQAPFRVVYFGKYIPLHGIEHILGAAHLLTEHAGIRFELYGDGQTYADMRAMARELALDNVAFFPDWLPIQELARRVAGAGVCLGVFGVGAKAQRVIPTKAFLALSLGLPLVTADTAGVRELLTDQEHALLCKPGDAHSLAAGILRLYQEPALRGRLAQQGQALYREHGVPQAVGAEALAAFRDLLP